MLVLKERFISEMMKALKISVKESKQQIRMAIKGGIIKETVREFAKNLKIVFFSLNIQVLSH